MAKLKIAQIAPVALPVGPGTGHSIEQLVWLLCEGLVARGHDVTLFATGDSETSARLCSRYQHGYEADDSLWDYRLHESINAVAAFERSHEFDVIHSHAYHFALPFTRLVPGPVIHTHHVELDPDVVDAYRRYPDATLVAVSEWQRSTLTGIANTAVIHHGIETSAFPFGARRGEYLVFLGRMIPDKGPRDAIELARTQGLPLVLAGPGEDYFERELRGLVDGELVRYVGPVGVEERNELLAGAAALLLPLRYPEPFGLVMVEAMACGTPVLALDIGAVPEIVEQGITGYHAASLAELAEKLPAALELDRARVRARTVERFDASRMVDGHEALYRRLVTAREST
jgi:glycosyltransferase involved in cell wall biosynthesis